MHKTTKKKVILWSLLLLFLGPLGLIIWLIVAIVVQSLSEPKDEPIPSVAVPAETSGDIVQRITQSLQIAATTEQDPQVAAGIQRALAIIANETQPTVPVPAPAPHILTPSEIQEPPIKPSQPLDQVVLMLYVGAFLLLSGMSLFIVYGGLPDVARLFLIGAMATGMYALGLMLYLAREALRPAAVAFLGIGLVMIPLTGYAAYYLLQADPYSIWLATSVIGLVAYIYALYVTKAEVVAYLVFLMWLSLAQSTVTLFGGTLQWFAWVSIALASFTMVLLPVLKKRIGPDLSFPFWLSSFALVPLAVFVSLGQVFSGDMALWQFGVSLLLGGVYSLSAFPSVRAYSMDNQYLSGYAVSAHLFSLFGILAIIYDTVFDDWRFGYILLIVAVIHLVAWLLLWTYRVAHRYSAYEWLLFFLSMAPILASWVWFGDQPWLSVLAAGVGVASAALLTFESRRQESAVFAVVFAMLTPLFVSAAVATPTPEYSSSFSFDTVALSVGYIVLALLFAMVRYGLRQNEELARYPLVGYVAAAGVAWLVTATSNDVDTFAIRIAVLVGVLGIALVASYVERAPQAIITAPIVLMSIIYGILHYATNLSGQEILAWSAVITAAVSYIYSLLSSEAERGLLLLYVSVGAILLAWWASAWQSAPFWQAVSPSVGLWLAALLYVEKTRLKAGAYFDLLPVFVVVLAVVQALGNYVPNLSFLVYTHIWAGYIAYVWYTLVKNGAQKDTVALAMYGTLAVLTFPMVGYALNEGTYYNLLLLTQQVAILTVGMLLRSKPVSIWATVTIIGVVLYALRSFGYIQLVIIAVALIGYAIFRLLNQHEDGH